MRKRSLSLELVKKGTSTRREEDGGVEGEEPGQEQGGENCMFGDDGNQRRLEAKAERKVTSRAKVGDWGGPSAPGREGQAEEGCEGQALERGHCDV